MKTTLSIFLFLFSASCLQAKTDPPAGIPHYKLLTKDSTYITDANLKKGTPTMIIYFAPDCTHCQKMTFEFQEEFAKETKAHTNALKHVQIVMATWTELRAIKAFYREFGLEKYPNISVGTEGTTYTLLHHYNVSTTPYIAIYSKTGQLVKAFAKVPTIEDIIAVLKKV